MYKIVVEGIESYHEDWQDILRMLDDKHYTVDDIKRCVTEITEQDERTNRWYPIDIYGLIDSYCCRIYKFDQ